MSEDRWRGGARPWPSNYTGGWHKDVSAAKKRIPQCPGVCCVNISLSPHIPCSALVVSSGPVSRCPVPRSGRHRLMSRGGGEKLCLLSALAALCHELDDLLQAPKMSPGPASPLHDTDHWLLVLTWFTGVTRDSRACWHQRLGFERNYKELIPSRPFSSATPTVPGLGAHIMLTLSQFRSGVFPGHGRVLMRRSSLLCSPDLKTKKVDMSCQNDGVTLACNVNPWRNLKTWHHFRHTHFKLSRLLCRGFQLYYRLGITASLLHPLVTFVGVIFDSPRYLSSIELAPLQT